MIIKEKEMNADRIIEACREMIAERINDGFKILKIEVGCNVYKVLLDDYKKTSKYFGNEKGLKTLLGYRIEVYDGDELANCIDTYIDHWW